MRRLQSGQQGEIAAERWFLNNGWQMFRTQPAINILGSKPGARYGRIFTVCMVGRGGVPDYTGYLYDYPDSKFSPIEAGYGALYRAVEVKESAGSTMPASRLDKAQREFMAKLPGRCAWVGVWWVDHQQFEMFPFKAKGSYKRGE